MPGERDLELNAKSNSTIDSDMDSQNVSPIKSSKKIINVDDLKGRVCYFSLSGDQALKAFEDIKLSTFRGNNKKKRLKFELTERLYFALLMFDRVVLHCSDPLRSEVVLSVLEENRQWVTSGKIVFIFSSKINNIREDYRKYIMKKIGDYSDGYNAEKEAASLSQEHITDEYYERVINLLDSTNYLVRKSNDRSNSFSRLVLSDLSSQIHPEQVIVDSSSDLSQILSLSLTLHQLLNVRLLIHEKNDSEGKGEFVFPQEVITEVSNQICEHLEQGNTIARSAIVDTIIEKIPQRSLSKQKKNILKAITLRMDVLYCRMNSGKQLILEFHPSYENRSVYQTDCFAEYLKLISETDTKIVLSPSMIDGILNDDNLNVFRLFYLACMADTREHLNFMQAISNEPKIYQETLARVFDDVVCRGKTHFNAEQFDSIKSILKGELS